MRRGFQPEAMRGGGELSARREIKEEAGARIAKSQFRRGSHPRHPGGLDGLL